MVDKTITSSFAEETINLKARGAKVRSRYCFIRCTEEVADCACATTKERNSSLEKFCCLAAK